MEQLIWACLEEPDGAVCAVATVLVRTWPLWGTLVIASILLMPLTLWLMWSTIGNVREEVERSKDAIVAAMRDGRVTSWETAQRRAGGKALDGGDGSRP